MNAPSTLSQALAEKALAEAGERAHAVTALMSGAAAILHRDFGPEVAADLMLRIVMEARTDLIDAGLIIETTTH